MIDVLGRAAALSLVAGAMSGCVSIQVMGPHGEPRLYGIGSVDRLPSIEGRVYRVRAPGLSLRIGPPSTGVSLGFAEAIWFVPAVSCEPAAYAWTVYGADVGSDSVVVGYDRGVGVPLPGREQSFVQYFEYIADDPDKTTVWRKEQLE